MLRKQVYYHLSFSRYRHANQLTRHQVKQKTAQTFEERHEAAPAGDGALAVELAQRQLHVEQRDAAHHQHDAVRHQERTCRGRWG